MATKKYYWLKLKNNFFKQKEIKKLRRIAGGDTYTVIYLKLQLLSLTTDGKLYFDGVEDTFVEEMALELDEEVENVRMTLLFLEKQGLIIQVENDEYILPEARECIGSESDKAALMRRKRARDKLLDSNNVTKELPVSYTEIEKEIEIEKDKELDIEIDNINLIPNNLQQVAEAWNSLNLAKVKSIKSNRLKLLNSRIKEVGIEGVIATIESIQKSSFLSGQNERGWTISFDWFLKPNNFLKVLEGNYIDKGKDDLNGNRNNGTRQNTSDASTFKGTDRSSEIKLTDEERAKLNGELI